MITALTIWGIAFTVVCGLLVTQVIIVIHWWKQETNWTIQPTPQPEKIDYIAHLRNEQGIAIIQI